MLEAACGVAFRRLSPSSFSAHWNNWESAETSSHFILDTDASSGHGSGAVLSQKQPDGTERVLAYGSHALYCHKRNYCATHPCLLWLTSLITSIITFSDVTFLCGQTTTP